MPEIEKNYPMKYALGFLMLFVLGFVSTPVFGQNQKKVTIVKIPKDKCTHGSLEAYASGGNVLRWYWHFTRTQDLGVLDCQYSWPHFSKEFGEFSWVFAGTVDPEGVGYKPGRKVGYLGEPTKYTVFAVFDDGEVLSESYTTTLDDLSPYGSGYFIRYQPEGVTLNFTDTVFCGRPIEFGAQIELAVTGAYKSVEFTVDGQSGTVKSYEGTHYLEAKVTMQNDDVCEYRDTVELYAHTSNFVTSDMLVDTSYLIDQKEYSGLMYSVYEPLGYNFVFARYAEDSVKAAMGMWKFCNPVYNEPNRALFENKGEGYYRVIVRNTDGCEDTSIINYTLPVTAVEGVSTQGIPKVFPNPTTGPLTIQGQFDQIGMYDEWGKQVRFVQGTGWQDQSYMDISELPNGNYILRTNLGDKTGAQIVRKE